MYSINNLIDHFSNQFQPKKVFAGKSIHICSIKKELGNKNYGIFVSGFLFGVRPTSKSNKSCFYKVLFQQELLASGFRTLRCRPLQHTSNGKVVSKTQACLFLLSFCVGEVRGFGLVLFLLHPNFFSPQKETEHHLRDKLKGGWITIEHERGI